MLYYKPYATLQMTMNPFRRLMERLPAAEKQKITAFQSDFADPEAGIGAFNLNLEFGRAAEGDPAVVPAVDDAGPRRLARDPG